MWQDEMISMAVVTCGCNDQALLEQSFSMDALGIIDQNVFFRDVIDTGHGGTFPVAFPAEHGNVHLVCSRFDIIGRKDVVISVALPASRGIGSTASQGSSVDASKEFFIGLIMTIAACDILQALRVGEIFYIRILMAIDTV
jgi:hypothetical protein